MAQILVVDCARSPGQTQARPKRTLRRHTHLRPWPREGVRFGQVVVIAGGCSGE